MPPVIFDRPPAYAANGNRFAALPVVLAAVLAAGLCNRPAQAAGRQAFPYEALVETEAAAVHGGPGKSYYATTRLRAGTKVSVRRHDPGGWFMIAPPQGSFSWIRADYVKQQSPERGVLTANNVVVRVGSSESDAVRDIEQVRLSTGDQVQILDKKTLQTFSGPTAFYKIVPPTGEYRWIAGQDVVAADKIVRQQQDQNPFLTPSNARRPVSSPGESNSPEWNVADNSFPSTNRSTDATPSVSRRPVDNAAGNIAERQPLTDDPAISADNGVWQSGPDPQQLTAQKDQLRAIDNEFRRIVNAKMDHWEFDIVERDYRQLQQAALLPAIANQIALRFDALQRYRKIKADYDELMRLTSETRRRDAELMSMSRGVPANAPVEDWNGGTSTLPNTPGPLEAPNPFAPEIRRPSAPAFPTPVENPGETGPSLSRPSVNGPTLNAPDAGANPSATPAPQPAPRFDGAGIIQPSPPNLPGVPPFVLITPAGRVLAYLQPGPGVQLQPYIGQALGLYGRRAFNPGLNTDLIEVQSITPVRLAP